MFYYLNRETGKRVSRETWKRSHAQGSTSYVRRTSKPSVPQTPNGGDSGNQSGSSQIAPRTYAEYEKLMKKKKLARYEEFDYDNGIEYETGVDY